MTFEQNDVLFGHDPATGIVAVECDAEGATLYVREADGSTSSRRESFTPFLWTDSEVTSDDVATRRLGGDLTFRCITECSGGWRHFSRLRTSLKNTGVKSFSLGDPVQQFLLQTGKTLFKGMEFEELRRMQLAIETHCADPDGVACAETPADHLLSITMSDASGWEQLLMIDPANPELSELAALEDLTRTIGERDPDVIEGHDLFRVALPYLTARAKLRKTKLTWGRDQSVPRSRASRLQIAEKTINYPKFEVAGRHFVDTFLLAQFYDVSARELEAFELADVAGHFHFSSEGQIAIAGERQDAHLNEPEKFAAHARRTVAQIREVATTLSASYFVQAKIFPYNYQDVVVRGNATKIDALLLREYYRRGHSIPDLPQARAFEGGYTDIFFSGIARDVAHCDVASLYPSVMLRFDCFPVQDQLGIFRGLLTDLRKFRLEAKSRLRDATGAERQYLNALQSTFKILINSFYGYLGFAQAHFADFGAAARVTEIGRDLLKKMVAWLERQGAQVIEIDTDGIYFV
ncbi:MAG: DNA polymerase II, partial [Verrucomicrobiota bacterium]|nr:DNA polymerase II [Verrucomicrobiota bacterium]